MSASFYAAILSSTVTCVGALAMGSMRRPVQAEGGSAGKLVRIPAQFSVPAAAWALLVGAACVLRNVLFG